MRIFKRVFPSYTLAMLSRPESPALPDYYRSTREEHYGPRAPGGFTISLNRDDIYGYRCTTHLSDIIEDGYDSDDDVELDSVVNSYIDHEPTFDFAYSSSPIKRSRGKCTLNSIKRFSASLLRRYRFGLGRGKEVVVRPASRLSIDLSK